MGWPSMFYLTVFTTSSRTLLLIGHEKFVLMQVSPLILLIFSPTSRMELFRQVRCQTAMFSFLLSLDRTAMDVGNKRLGMTLFIHIPPRISPYSEHTRVTNNGCKVTNRQLSKFHLDRASPASVDKLILILVGRERFLQTVLLTDFLNKERHRSHSREQKPKPKKT